MYKIVTKRFFLLFVDILFPLKMKKKHELQIYVRKSNNVRLALTKSWELTFPGKIFGLFIGTFLILLPKSMVLYN